jgi:hypothetical protein
MRRPLGAGVSALFACLLPCTGLAQGEEPERKTIYPHGVAWHKTTIADYPRDGDIGWEVDIVHRRRNALGEGSMFDNHLRTSVRPWVNWQVREHTRLSVSPLAVFRTDDYVATPSDVDRPRYPELRTTLQLKHWIDSGRAQNIIRIRQEFRIRKDSYDDEEWYTFHRTRLRYSLRVPLTTPSFYDPWTLYTNVFNEVGLNYGEQVVRNIFNQNRFYAGLGWRIGHNVRTEVGFVSQFRSRRTGNEFDHGRGMLVYLYVDRLGRGEARPHREADD